MGGEHRVQAFDAGVEAIDKEVQLIRFGGGARLIDLDPTRAESDQRHQIRTDQVAGDLQDEVPTGGLALAPAVPHRLPQVGVTIVAFVE